MFINPSILKKHLKKAYHTGVHIGSIDDGLVISQGHFIIWIDYRKVPNDIKAVVVEFLGIIPDENSGMFKASKTEPFAQGEIADEYITFLDNVPYLKYKTLNTNIMLNDYGKVFQIYKNEDSKTTLAADVDLIELFDTGKCDFDHGEIYPNDEPYTNDYNSMLYWVNDACKLIIFTADMTKNELYKEISATLSAFNFKEV